MTAASHLVDYYPTSAGPGSPPRPTEARTGYAGAQLGNMKYPADSALMESPEGRAK